MNKKKLFNFKQQKEDTIFMVFLRGSNKRGPTKFGVDSNPV